MSGRMLPCVTCTTGRVAVRTSSHHARRHPVAGGSGRRAPTQCTVGGRSGTRVLERRGAAPAGAASATPTPRARAPVRRQAELAAEPVVALLRLRRTPTAAMPRAPRGCAAARRGPRIGSRPGPNAGVSPWARAQRSVAERRHRDAARLAEQPDAVAQPVAEHRVDGLAASTGARSATRCARLTDEQLGVRPADRARPAQPRELGELLEQPLAVVVARRPVRHRRRTHRRDAVVEPAAREPQHLVPALDEAGRHRQRVAACAPGPAPSRTGSGT